MVATERQRRGTAAETAARRLLEQAGLELLQANARFRGGELDLVMRDPGDAGAVVFVEVRYRHDDGHGSGADSIDAGKRRRLVRAAGLWLARHPALALAACRFDVVQASGEPLQLDWIRDAFRIGE